MIQTETTTFIMHLSDGNSRRFSFPEVMSNRQAQDKLDPLIEEHNSDELESPIYIVRTNKRGQTRSEEIRIYSLWEQWEDPLM